MVGDPVPGDDSQAVAIDCASPTACMAVGVADGYHNSAWWWNGSSWHDASLPRHDGEFQSEVGSVSCPAVGTCIVTGSWVSSVGEQFAQSLRWDGHAWQQLSLPDTSVALSRLDCASTTACLTVGVDDPESGSTEPVVWRFSAGKWVVANTPPKPRGRDIGLSAVSCPTPDACQVGGSARTPDFSSARPYLVRGNGRTWTRSTLPAPPGLDPTGVDAISCSDSTHCVLTELAYTADQVAKTLILATTDGRTWSVQSQPGVPQGAQEDLPAVSCAAVCAAVGTLDVTSPPSLDEYALIRS